MKNFSLQKLKAFIAKVFAVLYIWDGIWSIPAAFLVYFVGAITGQIIFGEAWAAYPPSLVHAAIATGLIMVIFNLVAMAGLYFNFKGLFDFLTKDFSETFKNLTACQKVLFSLLFYAFLVLLALAIFYALV
jgi:hypothetical protein